MSQIEIDMKHIVSQQEVIKDIQYAICSVTKARTKSSKKIYTSTFSVV